MPSSTVTETQVYFVVSAMALIPPSLVAIPTHFYVVIAVVDVKSSKNKNDDNNKSAYLLLQFATFVLPHTDNVKRKERGDSGGGGNDWKIMW